MNRTYVPRTKNPVSKQYLATIQKIVVRKNYIMSGKITVIGSENFIPHYSNPKSFVNFLLPPLSKGRVGVG